MVTRPKINTASANVKMAEVEGIVTVGNPETARLLSKELGRTVEVGEKIDIGRLAYHHKNPFKRIWNTLRIKQHAFSKIGPK